MGLFNKKDPCAICGDKVTGLLPQKIAGQLVCKACYGYVHLPDGVVEDMTMDEFNAYRAFREENDGLRRKFQNTQQVNLSFLGDHIVFDMTNSLFCLDEKLESTVFEGKNIKSFVICEDGVPLFKGSASGLVCYTSTVPERAVAMYPMIDRASYYQDLPEPVQKFVIEIHCEHPYWKTIRMEKSAPTFNNSFPNINNYISEYNESVDVMGQLADALMEVAFPGVMDQRGKSNAASSTDQTTTASADVVDEILRFKSLAEQGIITEEEFTAKKRQLLGIGSV